MTWLCRLPNLRQSFTLSAWVKLAGHTAGGGHLLRHPATGDPSPVVAGVHRAVDTDSILDFSVTKDGELAPQLAARHTLGHRYGYGATQVDTRFNTPQDYAVAVGGSLCRRSPLPPNAPQDRLPLTETPGGVAEIHFGNAIAITTTPARGLTNRGIPCLSLPLLLAIPHLICHSGPLLSFLAAFGIRPIHPAAPLDRAAPFAVTLRAHNRISAKGWEGE